jgi:hypothetical protein
MNLPNIGCKSVTEMGRMRTVTVRKWSPSLGLKFDELTEDLLVRKERD